MRWLPASFLFLLILPGIAMAGDEKIINEALRNHQEVTLDPRVYLLDDTIYLNEGNVLRGQEGTTLRVSENSGQWYVGMKGIITSNSDNIVIENLEIDGNCDQLPSSFANYQGVHDAERGIIIVGSTGRFLKNIIVRNVKIHDCFSDAVHIRFSESVLVDNVFASNCQHSSIYFVCVINGIIQNCQIAGIGSDSVRVESSMCVKVLYCVLYGYFGSNSNGQYQGEHNLVQVGDQGHSMGSGSDKPVHTENIEIAYCTFSGKHLNTIWIDAAGKETTNLIVHDNKFVDMPEIENKGYSFENPPTVEESTEIFSNIYDFLKKDYTIRYPDLKQDFKAAATVTYFNNSMQPYSQVDVQGENIKVVKIQYAGKEAKHFLERDIWTGELEHVGKEVYLPGNFQPGDLQITVYGDAGYQKIENIKINEEKLTSAGINPDLFIFLAILAVLGITTYRNIKRIL